MKALVIVCAMLFSSVVLADPRQPTLVENTEAVVRVDIGDKMRGSGLVVSTEGHILITAYLADACDGCQITVSEGGEGQGSYKATMLAFDRKIGLAVIKADHVFPRAVVLEEDLTAVSSEDEMAIIGFHYLEGKTTQVAPILTLKYSDDEVRRLGWSPCALAQYMGAQGMLGSGGFNSRTGRLIGAVLGGHRIALGGETVYASALATAPTIRLFLYINRVPYVHPRPTIKLRQLPLRTY